MTDPVAPVVLGSCWRAGASAHGIDISLLGNFAYIANMETIEIVDVPEVALAAAEDLEDSRERLSELVDWMTASLAE